VRAKQSLKQKPLSAIAVIDAGKQDTANDDGMFIAKESEFKDATKHQPWSQDSAKEKSYTLTRVGAYTCDFTCATQR
jgi:hypothetical protein